MKSIISTLTWTSCICAYLYRYKSGPIVICKTTQKVTTITQNWGTSS
jgi:hypothetical protein